MIAGSLCGYGSVPGSQRRGNMMQCSRKLFKNAAGELVLCGTGGNTSVLPDLICRIMLHSTLNCARFSEIVLRYEEIMPDLCCYIF